MRGGRKSVGVILAPNNHPEGELTKIRHWIVIAMMFCVSCLVGTTHSIAAMITAKSPAYESQVKNSAIDPPPRTSWFNVWATIQATTLVIAWTLILASWMWAASYSIAIGAISTVAVTSILLCGSLGFGRAKNYAPHRRGFVTDWMSMLHTVPRAVLVLISVALIATIVAGVLIALDLTAAIIASAAVTYVSIVLVSNIANAFGHRSPVTSLATATTLNGLPNTGQGNHGTTSYTLNFRRWFASTARDAAFSASTA